MKTIYVKKASGESVPYSESKLLRSLMKSGASEAQAQHIVEETARLLKDGISTRDIYRHAFSLLKADARHLAARYHLKRAMMELGPSGFPFEKYMAAILKEQGYKTETGRIFPGKCVNHEIDVLAEKDTKRLLIECKYHSQQGVFCDVKVPLYIHSRFNDVMAAGGQSMQDVSTQGWIMTNTRFSVDAERYASCAGLHLMAWDFPKSKGLKDMIDAMQLYPVTCLTSLAQEEKQFLLDHGQVLCRDIVQRPALLKQAGMSAQRIDNVLEEARQLCSSLKPAVNPISFM